MQKIMDLIERIDKKKRQLDAFRPLPAELEKNLQEWFAIEFMYTSNAIEGNTLSLSETAIVVEKGITIGDKTIVEHLEAVNHAQAIDFIAKLAKQNRSEVVLDDILLIHKILLQKIDDLNAGVLRQVMIHDTNSSANFPNYAKVPFLMIEFMDWLHKCDDHPILIAARAHYKLISISPFTDANGKAARLLMNLLLLQQGYPLAIIKKERGLAYIQAIEIARKTDDFVLFYEVILQAVEYTLNSYLEAVRESYIS